MRISDWSSDVCSSDLGGRAGALIEEAAGSAVVAVGRRQIVEAGEIGHFANRADRGIEIGAVRGILESHFERHAREIVGDRHGEAAVAREIRRASCRERVCPFVLIVVASVTFKKTMNINKQQLTYRT